VDYPIANRNAAEGVLALAQERRIVSHPAVSATVPGTTQRRNLEDNQGAGRGRLPDSAMRRRIEQYWDTLG
jgi:hypothetical protein